MSKKRKKETGRVQGIIQMVLLMLLGAFIGGAGSAICFIFKDDIANILREAENITGNYSDWALLFLSLVLFILAPLLTFIVAKKMKRWDEDSEEETEQLERSIQRYQSTLSVFMIAEMCISGISIGNLHTEARTAAMFSVTAVLIYAVMVFWNLFFIGKLIKYDKKINPEKRGNFFSWNFNKEWLASCDEREKLRMFQAAYYTRLKTQFVYLAVFIGLLILSNAVEVGVVPFLILMVIWVSQSLIYWYEYEKKR